MNPIQSIPQLKEHLQNCSLIMDRFIKKYHINICYFDVNACVISNISSRISFSHLDELDSYTIKQVKEIQSNLYNEFAKYLKQHEIVYPLHIQSIQGSSWAITGIQFKFEITVNL